MENKQEADCPVLLIIIGVFILIVGIPVMLGLIEQLKQL